MCQFPVVDFTCYLIPIELHYFICVKGYLGFSGSVFTGIFCVHCNSNISSNLRDILEHCRLCSFMQRTDVLKHKYVCYACSYATYYNGNMKNHIRIHLGDRPFICKLCNYTATRKTHLNVHMRNHEKKLNGIF
ncbi:histone-lysine N-methyltransferase PRDM9-like [Diaphorina citri]|uniref:Histone-lysine N-methyltransferase PRDM9-like n=1 Tax=Diaphorina citri TaxID=121845 RepID=A0A1S3CYA4_DIACI|nr:histone-lysine N-methyltransferase PRDM9-like [Diaphorina citri]